MDSIERKKITILGSANFDTFLFVDRLPEMGETISADGLLTACGGKGANQAVTVGKLGYDCDFVGQVGNDAAGLKIKEEMARYNVNVEKSIKILDNVPTGQAFVFSFKNKNNSIIIAGGANVEWKDNDLEVMRESLKKSNLKNSLISIIYYSIGKYLLLQREIPDDVNLRGSILAKEYGVNVLLDMGGADIPLSTELLSLLKIISPNKTEFRRILNRDVDFRDNDKVIEALEEMRTISNNKALCLLLKLGSKGSLYIDEANNIYKQNAYSFKDMPILDTTGAGDCFTASFATGLVDGKSIEKALIFASASAYVAISRVGAMPSLPSREDVEKLLARIEG